MRGSLRHIWFALMIMAVAAVAVGLVASPAMCGPRAHDSGFFLRLSGGVGYAKSETTFDLTEPFGEHTFEASKVSGDANFAIGGIIANNLALHGTLWGWSITDPTVKVDGTSTSASGDLSMGAFGGGVTYYFMPANVYLSGSVGLGILTSEDESTDPGFASDLTIGKEWWVGTKWGLGVAGAFGYHNIPEKDFDARWEGYSFAVRFTATLN